MYVTKWIMLQGWLKGLNVTKGLRGRFPGGAYITRRDFNDSGYGGTPHRKCILFGMDFSQCPY